MSGMPPAGQRAIRLFDRPCLQIMPEGLARCRVPFDALQRADQKLPRFTVAHAWTQRCLHSCEICDLVMVVMVILLEHLLLSLINESLFQVNCSRWLGQVCGLLSMSATSSLSVRPAAGMGWSGQHLPTRDHWLPLLPGGPRAGPVGHRTATLAATPRPNIAPAARRFLVRMMWLSKKYLLGSTPVSMPSA